MSPALAATHAQLAAGNLAADPYIAIRPELFRMLRMCCPLLCPLMRSGALQVSGGPAASRTTVPRSLLAIRPRSLPVSSLPCACPLHSCSGLDPPLANLCDVLRAAARASLRLGVPPALQRELAEARAASIAKRVVDGAAHATGTSLGDATHRSRRIRIAYISGNFGAHTLMGTHLLSVFGLHDASRFEVFCFALSASDGRPLYQAGIPKSTYAPKRPGLFATKSVLIAPN